MSDEDSDFCARCGTGIWQHGVNSYTSGGRSYCSKCDPLDEPALTDPTSEPKPQPKYTGAMPPPLPTWAAKPPTPPPLPKPEPPPTSPSDDNSSDFCYDCGTGVYMVGASSEEIDGKVYCWSCAQKHKS